MAHYATGTFFGYRALEPLAAGRVRAPRLWPGRPRWPVRMRVKELEVLSPSYDYVVFSGVAPDNYPALFVNVGFLTTKIHCRIWDNPAEIAFSYDGTTAVYDECVDEGFHRMKMVRGFRIRNYIPGMDARYQFTFFR